MKKLSPLGTLYRRWAALGALGVAAGGLIFVADHDFRVTALITALLGAGFGAVGAWGLSRTRALGPLEQAADGVLSGRFAEAEAALCEAERASITTAARRDVALQRAAIALRRGDFAAAEQQVDALLALPLGLLGRASGERVRAVARGLRAMARAYADRREEARADIAAVRADPDAPPAALAHVAVAEAVILERSGERAALSDLLSTQGALLFEVTAPRERALMRAFQRMLRASAPGVYRSPARSSGEASGDEPALGAWVARIAPAAVPAPAAAPRRAPRAFTVSGIALAVAFVVGTSAVAWVTSASDRSPIGRWLDFAAVFLPGLLGFYAVYFAPLIAPVSRDERRLGRALVLVMRGDLDAGRAAFEEIARSRRRTTAAAAHLGLAQIAERRGALDDALACCDRALAALPTPALRAATSETTYPAILAERAFVLAALDRGDDAAAELAALPPGYLLGAAARRRVEMVRCVRSGKLDLARRALENAPSNLGASRRDELLMDLVRAAGGGAGAAEVARLGEELAAYLEGRRWIEIVAPGAIAAFEELRAHGSAEEEAIAEAEAAAELEAEEPRRAAR